MSLSERLRPGVECAPWVIEEVKKLEAALRSEPVAIGEMKEGGVYWYNQNPHAYPIGTKFYAEPSRESRAEPVAGQLSAEQVESKFDANDAPSPKHVEHIRFEGRDCVVLSPEGYEYLYAMALRSLTARDEGIEAAAKWVDQHKGNLVRYDVPASIRALAQGQRTTEQDADELFKTYFETGGYQYGDAALANARGWFRAGFFHAAKKEQDADALLREALDAYDHIVVKTGYQGDFDTSAGRAHLARKEPK